MTYTSHNNNNNNYINNINNNRDRVGLHYVIWNERRKADFTGLIDKKVERVELLPGFYGYTYLGGDKMWINRDLVYKPDEKEETEVHEAIHTDDEYETRVVSRDMIKKESDAEIIARLAYRPYQSFQYDGI